MPGEPGSPIADRGLGLVLGIGVTGALLALVLLIALNGPTEDGVRCARGGPAPAACEILRSRFLGFFGNSAFPVPESDVRGARVVCGTARVGRASSSCNVYLEVRGRGGYLVLSFRRQSQAEGGAATINAYLSNPAANLLEIRESVTGVLLLRLGLPALIIGLVLGFRAWRSRRRTEPGL